jgi:mRNA interferase RelE/StbE
MASIELTTDALEDLLELDGSVLPRVLKKLVMLEQDPEAGRPLGRRSKSDLTTFRKVVVGDRDWRIIYRIEEDGTVVVIWVIAARSDDEVYSEAVRRIETSPESQKVILVDALEQLTGGRRRRASEIYPGSRLRHPD